MAGKKKIDAEVTSRFAEIEEYSRQIWLAGLGAYSKASKGGKKIFENLVKDGEEAEQTAKSGLEKGVEAVKSTLKSSVDATVGSKVEAAKSKVDEVKDKALGKWSELEDAFDKRLSRAVARLGVPSRAEVKELHAKVELLTKQLEKLTGISVEPVKAAKAAPKKAAAKTEAKPAAKAAVKKAPVRAAKPAAPVAPVAAPVVEAAAVEAPVVVETPATQA